MERVGSHVYSARIKRASCTPEIEGQVAVSLVAVNYAIVFECTEVAWKLPGSEVTGCLVHVPRQAAVLVV